MTWKKEEDGGKLCDRVIAGNKGKMKRSAVWEVHEFVESATLCPILWSTSNNCDALQVSESTCSTQ